MRLNQLQILFLLRLVLVSRLSEPDASLLGVSQEILSLVVEIIVLRDQIVNSGTGLVWKVSESDPLSIAPAKTSNAQSSPRWRTMASPAARIHLPRAAGTTQSGRDGDTFSGSKMLRDLNVLVSEGSN